MDQWCCPPQGVPLSTDALLKLQRGPRPSQEISPGTNHLSPLFSFSATRRALVSSSVMSRDISVYIAISGAEAQGKELGLKLPGVGCDASADDVSFCSRSFFRSSSLGPGASIDFFSCPGFASASTSISPVVAFAEDVLRVRGSPPGGAVVCPCFAFGSVVFSPGEFHAPDKTRVRSDLRLNRLSTLLSLCTLQLQLPCGFMPSQQCSIRVRVRTRAKSVPHCKEIRHGYKLP